MLIYCCYLKFGELKNIRMTSHCFTSVKITNNVKFNYMVFANVIFQLENCLCCDSCIVVAFPIAPL